MPYASPLPERAVLFSTPGGLTQTVERERPGIGSAIRKIEGPEIIYGYLEKLPEMRRRKMNPLIVDCLNCDMGCNGGTGTDNHEKSPDEVEYHVEKRKRAMQKQYAGNGIGTPNYRRKVNRLISRYWKPGLYGREYRDRSDNYAIRTPNTTDLAEIHRKMLKTEPKDYLNCSSCGYNSCEMMASAIFNGLNKPENCRHYQQTTIRRDHEVYARISASLDQEINKSTDLVQKISATLQSVNDRSQDQYASLEQSSAAMEEMIASIGNASKVAVERTSTVAAVIGEARKGEEFLRRTVSGIEEIERSVESISGRYPPM